MPYADPVKQRMCHKNYYQARKQQWREEWRNYKLRHPERMLLYASNHRNAHPADVRLSMRKYNDRLRVKLLLLLGGCECRSCHYDTNVYALQIDHIDGNGREDERRLGRSHAMYRYYLLHPEEALSKLQVLCANCNYIKRYHTDVVDELLATSETFRLRYRILSSFALIQCVGCSFGDIRALQLDHKNSDGAIVRRQFSNSSSRIYYHYLRNPESVQIELQILCVNCNVIKKRVQKECSRKLLTTPIGVSYKV